VRVDRSIANRSSRISPVNSRSDPARASLWASDPVREAAIRFLRVHALRAADALQLAAAFIAAERRPPSLTVVTLDDRLAAAARKEGFVLVPQTV
jgi:predicted nucleic acid-binding protein